MPPIHPAIVHFPIALLALSILADTIGYFRKVWSADAIGFWALVGATLGGGAAVGAGYLDARRLRLPAEPHSVLHAHIDLGWTVLVVVVLLAVWRWVLRIRAGSRVGRAYLAFAFLTLALTFAQGYYGGEMVYSHGVGVAPAGLGVEPAESARKRILPVRDAILTVDEAVESRLPEALRRGDGAPTNPPAATGTAPAP